MQRIAAISLIILIGSVAGALQARAQSNEQPAEASAPLQRIVPDEEFLPPEVRAKQADDFDNPAFASVQAGEAAWSKTEGDAGKACQDCHGVKPADLVKNAVATYPKYSPPAGKVIALAGRINICRVNALKAPPLAEGSDRMVAMTAFLRWHARGLAATADVNGPAAAVYEKGKELYFTKIGLLKLSCADCHDKNYGQKFGGETITQGHPSGFPVYSLGEKRMISLHERLRMCNKLARAEPQPVDSPDYVALELYLNARGKGLPITAPGVRP